MIFKSFLMSVLLISNVNAKDLKTFPFNHTLDMDLIREVVNTTPQNLIKKINSLGVDVLLVKSNNRNKSINPLFKNLKKASKDLLKKAEYLEEYEGKTLYKEDLDLGIKRDTILISDRALSYTLIHEFIHTQLSHNQDLDFKFNIAFRTLMFRQRKLYDNSYQLMNPAWRRDILSAQSEVVDTIAGKIEEGQSQEAVIEKVLSKVILKSNPFYDEIRVKNGLQYGESRINNAIDIFNDTENSISFSRETVKNIYDGISSGEIEADPNNTISKKDADDYVSRSNKIYSKLESTKTMILELKKFFVADDIF